MICPMKRHESKLKFTAEEMAAYAKDNQSESTDDNSAVDSANAAVDTAEQGVHGLQSVSRSHSNGRQNKPQTPRQQPRQSSGNSSSKSSKVHQKSAIKKEYAAAKSGKKAKRSAAASKRAAKAARKAANDTQKTVSFVARHPKEVAIAIILIFMVLFIYGTFSACSVMLQGGTSTFSITTYPVKDEDMLAAEAGYLSRETDLREYIDSYESTHDYDEYHFDIGTIAHDPHALISALTVLHRGGWTVGEVGGLMDTLFDTQYVLTEDVIVEVRYRTETRTGSYTYTDPETGEDVTEYYDYEEEVPYDYYICNVTLTVTDLSSVALGMMDEEQTELFNVYMITKGNRPELF